MSEFVNKIQELFISKNMTLAVAESLTGGNIQAMLTSIPGASNYFSGGLTAYNIRQKVDILGVDEENAKKSNCVSYKTAEEMAKGISLLMNTDFGVATTGYVSPTLDIEEAHAYISVYSRIDDSSYTFLAVNSNYIDRPSSQKFFSILALKALIEKII